MKIFPIKPYLLTDMQQPKKNIHPILFSTDMVKAILEGRKTQTRRIIKPQPDEGGVSFMKNPPLRWEETTREQWKPWMWNNDRGEHISKNCPYGKPGDLLWVRETWAKHSTLPGAYEYLERVAGTNLQYQHKWKPSIHMPYEAARIKLIVKRVWVERLNIINWDDATAEGVEQFLDPNSPFYENYVDYTGTDLYCYSPISSYESLWTKINGPKSWASNPWVWCVEFKEMLVRI